MQNNLTMRILFIILLCWSYLFAQAQQKSYEPITKKKPVAFCKTPPLKTLIPFTEKAVPVNTSREAHDMESSENGLKISSFYDPVRQNQMGNKSAPPLLINFNGLGPMDETCTNPDTEGDVGLNHYMQMVKRSFAIWDKEGNLLYGPANNKTLWSTLPGPWLDYWFTDPIVIYDHLEDRWLASNMVYEIETEYLYWEVIAVSVTPDPLGEWYCYVYQFEYMPDYPKFGVWNNEYVMTINDFEIYQGVGTFMGSRIWAFNKEDLLNGISEPGVIEFITDSGNGNLWETPSCWLPSDLDGMPAQTNKPNYLVYVKDDLWGFENDHLSLWELTTDWENPDNSSFEEVQILEVEPFAADYDNWYVITQPNTSFSISSMIDRLMYRLQYRKFKEYEMLITNHTVNVDTNYLTGVRWYELRNYGEGWSIFQQGSYSPDNHHRWMGSVSMDNRGNIAAGYSVSSEEIYPSIRMTGRFDTDPIGLMSLEEIEVATGEGCQTQNWRWGDYSYMSVDPVDDQTFWYTQMYMPVTGQIEWQTKICSFKIAKELSFNTDTLFFNTIEECLNGKTFTLKNNSWDTILVNSIEQEGYLMNAWWHIDEMPITLPSILPISDSLNLLVKVDFTVNQSSDGYFYDTLSILANTTYKYDIIIAINDDFLTGISGHSLAENNINIFPNPFTNQTTISFSLERTSRVDLEILDSKFNKLAVLLSDKKLKKGDYNFAWSRFENNQKEISSGIYFCKITISDKTVVKKIIMN